MKILLAVDGSACSDAAVSEVARRPWPADTQVRIISMVEPATPLVAESYAGVAGYFEEGERIKQRQAVEAVGHATETLRPHRKFTDFGPAQTLP